jgi:hypothetical protein
VIAIETREETLQWREVPYRQQSMQSEETLVAPILDITHYDR